MNKKEYYLENREEILRKKKEHHKKYPWKRVFKNINIRCYNPEAKSYKDYGGKGIKNYLTEEEIKELWFRDKAYDMDKPSIDREDHTKDYTFDNCRFIEWGLNSAERNTRVSSKPILQLDLNGIFIKEWDSIAEAQKTLVIYNISKCAKGKFSHAGGYKWRYKN